MDENRVRSGRRRRAWRWLMAAGMVTAITAIGVGLRPHHRLLLPRATRLLPLSDDTHYWLFNAHEALVIKDDPHPPHWQRYPTVHIFRQDLTTGHQVFVPALSAWYNTLWMNYNYEFQPSRDGKWLLLTQNCIRVHASGLTTVDGAHHVEYGHDYMFLYATCWLQDGHSWAEILENDATPPLLTLLLHDMRTPTRQPIKCYCRVPKAFKGFVEQVVVASPHHIIGIHAQANGAGDQAVVSVFEADPQDPARQTHVYTIPAPSGYQVRTVALSPDGTRLLWRFVVRYTDPIQQWLHRVFPAVKAPMTLRTVLCVSQVNGDRLREIGYQDGDPYAFNDNEDGHGYTRWLSDSKRASFVYKDVLYTVPVD